MKSYDQNRKKEHQTSTLNARQLAVRILTRIEKEGAYANLLLQAYLAELDDRRERNLTTALVNGVLKNKVLLDYALRKHLTKPMSALPVEVRQVLRTGALQILYMDKIPVPVAINEAVNTVKYFRKSYAALVNKVLRQTAETGWNFSWPDKKRETQRYLAVKYSHPEWLIKRWLKRYGAQETEELLKANNIPSDTCIRVNTLKITPVELIRKLEEKGIETIKSSKLPDALFIKDYGALEDLDLFQEGYFTVQDESSQLAAYLLAPQAGQRVLDVCSAPGGKTTYLAQLMRNCGEIIATDIYPQKLELVNQLARRLGITIIKIVQNDARQSGQIQGQFDKVLVDAPCSGLGVLRRRADLRWQKREDEIQELPQLQLAILLSAADKVAPGGDILYSTCTTEPEENFEIVKAFRKERPDFSVVDLTEELPFKVTAESDLRQLRKGVWQILPHLHDMDGFFIAKMKRKEE
ncbi:MAG: 16S rRNA (cytosine(967)-C(5))-methyltransferase RsmB [Peptococcaceae bacterium]|jgi:16S rRNA (cytosine967-C5)-methyltransferase|nr:16S rRNA (cytosine(967)-C(5))-methyltransferase RsmB [Peptococcaceae bacterium]